MHWLFLFIAIISEIIATSTLKASEGFTKLIPSVITVIGYGISFYFLSLAVKSIPIGITYALWSGIGIICITTIGYFFYKEPLNWPTIIGIAFILIGVVIVNLSNHTSH
ncbi:multidrug efflux SMR transporter [Flammeovirga sp. SR4]|uniref:Multidrug efflux SMR transporter n=2 Tax=Flammeovirga agarivorans TaxID=2726742 RepID=A0A7X8SQW4_9BACT|nr:multidrug efflux SMR transporter [Flammeovirga agarivorans]NLR94751.1 multidrug efflux SMR transporter [Flammeovirga agarivorans]